MKSYNTVHTGGQGEIVEKKSRFIANVFPVTSEEEAFQRLEETRKKHWDARHNCWAYVLGGNPPTERMSDDGEPAGTAGARGRDTVFRRDSAGDWRSGARIYGCCAGRDRRQ